MAASRRGMILILSSPSGAGKTTLTRMLMQDKTLDLTLSVSVTTRPRRSSEVDGIHYRFIDQREFDRMKKGGDLLEWAEVHSNFYGTPREPVEKVLAQGRDMLFDVDWQGARQMRERLGGDVVSIFVLPPSMRALRARLERRAVGRNPDHQDARGRLALGGFVRPAANQEPAAVFLERLRILGDISLVAFGVAHVREDDPITLGHCSASIGCAPCRARGLLAPRSGLLCLRNQGLSALALGLL